MYALTVFLLLLAGLIGLSVVSLLNSFAFQVALRLVVKRTTEPERAFVSMFVVSIASVLVGGLVGYALAISGPYGEAFQFPAIVLSIPIGFVLMCGVIMPRHALNLGEAVLVTLVLNLIWLVLAGAAGSIWLAVRLLWAAYQGYING